MGAEHSPPCRFCRQPLKHVFADLGEQPLANSNLTPAEISNERRYPLIARVCSSCLLVQVDDAVPPTEIFTHYDYFSSMSTEWVAHAKRYSDAMRQRFSLGAQSLVVEVASNDGYLLQHFKAAGVRVLGIEPARNVAAVATAAGIATETAFFDREFAHDLARRVGKADLMVANNVLAHVPRTLEFVSGFAELLAPNGVATFEFPHLLALIENCQFDTIYHEHFCYFSLLTAERVLEAADLRVFDVEKLPTHGGSLRLFVGHRASQHTPTPRLDALRRQEAEHGLDKLAGHMSFADRIASIKSAFLKFLAGVRAEGKTIVGYGAAAKGNTFLNTCGVDYREIAAIFDRGSSKQGKLTPGSHIPILAPERIAEFRPDYVLILPWNIADEIVRSLPVVRSWGGRFVLAVPDLRVL